MEIYIITVTDEDGDPFTTQWQAESVNHALEQWTDAQTYGDMSIYQMTIKRDFAIPLKFDNLLG